MSLYWLRQRSRSRVRGHPSRAKSRPPSRARPAPGIIVRQSQTPAISRIYLEAADPLLRWKYCCACGAAVGATRDPRLTVRFTSHLQHVPAPAREALLFLGQLHHPLRPLLPLVRPGALLARAAGGPPTRPPGWGTRWALATTASFSRSSSPPSYRPGACSPPRSPRATHPPAARRPAFSPSARSSFSAPTTRAAPSRSPP